MEVVPIKVMEVVEFSTELPNTSTPHGGNQCSLLADMVPQVSRNKTTLMMCPNQRQKPGE